MNKKKINYIGLIIFVVVFASLVTIASIYDLQISRILTKGSLAVGEYYTNNIVARIYESICFFPLFLFGVFAFVILTHTFYLKEGKIKYLAIIFALIGIGFATYFVRDVFKYIFRYYNLEDYLKKIWMLLIFLCLGSTIYAVMTFFYRKVPSLINEKLISFTFVIICSCACYLLIEVIKSPVGRMRYRAMNVISDFSYFTPWYQISHVKDTLLGTPGIPSDGFKSFPSGHTFSGSMIYLLLCLPDLFYRFNNKKTKIILYMITILYTASVGIFRIVCGAHYMSDVLFGGTLGFVAVMIFRYIFILRKKKEA
ncbi:MAG: phosphatase PAP2 family protein [Bacillales bacterium]|nr:phosphatase PAP2 family protein [Bacillales bacterium]